MNVWLTNDELDRLINWYFVLDVEIEHSLDDDRLKNKLDAIQEEMTYRGKR